MKISIGDLIIFPGWPIEEGKHKEAYYVSDVTDTTVSISWDGPGTNYAISELEKWIAKGTHKHVPVGPEQLAFVLKHQDIIIQ
jgi:hypothetical protein